jgi:hypothetical protein
MIASSFRNLVVLASAILAPMSSFAVEGDMCAPFGMGLDMQAQLKGFRVATCLRGMGPTHMIIVNESSDSSRYSVRSVLLDSLREPKEHEDSPTVGLKAGSHVFYRATEQGVVYEIDVSPYGHASFSMIANGVLVYSDSTHEVVYGDLIPPSIK